MRACALGRHAHQHVRLAHLRLWPLAAAQEAQEAASSRYAEATGGKPERLVSGSDDFTLCLYEPSTSKQPITRMTGHVQLINQVRQATSLVECRGKLGNGAKHMQRSLAFWLGGFGFAVD